MVSKISPIDFDENFIFIKELGSGTFGAVYEYEEKDSKIRVKNQH